MDRSAQYNSNTYLTTNHHSKNLNQKYSLKNRHQPAINKIIHKTIQFPFKDQQTDSNVHFVTQPQAVFETNSSSYQHPFPISISGKSDSKKNSNYPQPKETQHLVNPFSQSIKPHQKMPIRLQPQELIHNMNKTSKNKSNQSIKPSVIPDDKSDHHSNFQYSSFSSRKKIRQKEKGTIEDWKELSNDYGLTIGNNQKKYSLRNNNNKSNKVSKPQIYLCLKYNDLSKTTSVIDSKLKTMPEKPTIQIESSQYKSILPAKEKGRLTKYLCNAFKAADITNEGCLCQPKCHWMDKWLTKAGIGSMHTEPDRQSIDSLKQEKQSVKSSSRVSYGHKNTTNTTQYNETNESQTHKAAKQEEEYLSKNLKQIEKDIPRTQSTHPTFKDNEQYRMNLKEVLYGMCLMDKEVGYVQGMNIIASVILYHARNNYETLRVFQFIMKKLNYRQVYVGNLEFCRHEAARVIHYLKRTTFDLYQFLVNEHQIDLLLFVSSWYFSMCGSFIPLQEMHLVIDKFVRKQFTGITQLIITLLIFLKQEIMSQDSQQEVMLLLSNQKLIDASSKIDWKDLIQKSQNLDLDFTFS